MFLALLPYHQGVHKVLLYKQLLNGILTTYTCGRACDNLAYRLVYTADRIVTLDIVVACAREIP